MSEGKLFNDSEIARRMGIKKNLFCMKKSDKYPNKFNEKQIKFLKEIGYY